MGHLPGLIVDEQAGAHNGIPSKAGPSTSVAAATFAQDDIVKVFLPSHPSLLYPSE